MLNNREKRQLRRLKTMKAMESHRPLVVKSLNNQIASFKSKSKL